MAPLNDKEQLPDKEVTKVRLKNLCAEFSNCCISKMPILILVILGSFFAIDHQHFQKSKKTREVDQSSAKIASKDFRLFELRHDHLHFHTAVKGIFLNVISAKIFEFDPLNSE